MSDVRKVTQADRDAAKSLLGRDDAGPSWWSIDSGNADDDPMVQAFARHREATEAPLRGIIGELVDAMVRYEMDTDPDVHVPVAHRDMMSRARAALKGE